jgi:hypothetical protein
VWQVDRLSKDARRLLARVDAETRVQASGAAAKQLEVALLVASEQVHTDAGAHALELSRWDAFATRRGVGEVPAPAVARARVEQAVAAMAAGVRTKLPWM